MVLFSLPFFMDYATVFSCALIECIESIKSDVKKKIAPASACERHTKVTRQVKDEIFLRETTKRAKLDPKQIDECIMGNVISAGLGQNPARQAALFGGLSPEVSAMTVNKVCGSGLKAVALAAQAIQTGNSSVVVAGGMESMSNAPYLLPPARKGCRLGNAQIIDSMVRDGLWDIYNDYHMGITGENVAEKYRITREEQDQFAVNSHRKAVSAIK